MVQGSRVFFKAGRRNLVELFTESQIFMSGITGGCSKGSSPGSDNDNYNNNNASTNNKKTNHINNNSNNSNDLPKLSRFL